MIFITPQFNRNILKVKQFYRLKIVSQYLKDKYQKLVQISSAKSFSVIFLWFFKIISHAQVYTNYPHLMLYIIDLPL